MGISHLPKSNKGYTAGGLTLTGLQKANASAISSGSDINGTALSASALPVIDCVVQAYKPAADADTMPTANTGDVWLVKTDDAQKAFVKLEPGQSFSLGNCDLANILLCVETANDGVILSYKT